MTDYPIIIDLWEENAKFDEQTAKDAGILGVVIRLNDMGGGHHIDTNAHNQWNQSSIFPVRAWYFVYNPWVKGAVNAKWFLDNFLVCDGKTMFLDVEVKKTGYSSKEYANQVEDCIRILKESGWKVVIYTGSWFLSYLNRWPKDVDYWWARYPDAAKPTANTWPELVQKVRALNWTPDLINGKNVSPGEVKLWQVSDKWSPPGCYGHAIDANIFNGTEQECLSFFGVSQNTPIPEPTIEHWYDGMSDHDILMDLLTGVHNL